MSKQEWIKTQETRDVTRWQIDLGGVCLELADYRDSVFCAIIGDLAKDIDAASQEQAQDAALAWARSVLGKALVEAGADVAENSVNYKDFYPGFTVICEKCNSQSVRLDNSLGHSAESGSWGSMVREPNGNS